MWRFLIIPVVDLYLPICFFLQFWQHLNCMQLPISVDQEPLHGVVGAPTFDVMVVDRPVVVLDLSVVVVDLPDLVDNSPQNVS